MTDELLKALQLIKEECENNKDKRCTGCPLLDAAGECGVMSSEPSLWPLEKREVYF